MVDARSDAQPDRLEPGLAHQQELVDREIRGEDAVRVALAAQAPEAGKRVLGNILSLRVGHQMLPSSSLVSVS